MNKLNKIIMLGLLLGSSGVLFAHDKPLNVIRETLSCGEQGCVVTCYQAEDRWQSFLQTTGDIEVSYFLNTGVRQLKAPVADGSYTVLDTHPQYQTCRITGVVK